MRQALIPSELPDIWLAMTMTFTTALIASTGLLAGYGQQPSAGSALTRMLWPMAIIVVLAGLLLAALSIVRRRMRHFDQPPAMRGFTLADLRDLRRSGQLTEEEFEKAKAKIVAGVQASIAKEAKPAPNAEPLNLEPKE